MFWYVYMKETFEKQDLSCICGEITEIIKTITHQLISSDIHYCSHKTEMSL